MTAFRPRLLLLWVFCLGWLGAWRDTPFLFSISGARSMALGGNSATGVPTVEGLYGNPALLAAFTNGYLAYEFDADFRFRGIRTDYRITFDYVASAGALLPAIPIGKGRLHLGLGFFTLFRGTGTAGQVGDYAVSIRKLGLSFATPLLPNLWAGLDVGPAIAYEGGAVAFSPSVQGGILWRLAPEFLVGLYALGPHLFDWKAVSGLNQGESTPATVELGFQVTPVGALSLLATFSWQGWDLVTYQKSGVSGDPSRGASFFDAFQDWFVSAGVVYRSSGRLVDDPLDAEAEARAARLEREIRDLSARPGQKELEDRLSAALTREREAANEAEDMKALDLPPDVRKKIIVDEELLGLRRRELAQARANADEAKLSAEERARWSIRKKALEDEIEPLSLSIRERKEKRLSPDEEIRFSQLTNTEVLARTEKEDCEKALRLLSTGWIERLKVARAAVAKGESLDVETERELFRERSRGEKEAELKELRVRLSRPVRRLASLPRGEYYLSFRPEVAHLRDGTINSRGNLAVGFSFRPANIDRLSFNLSFQDQSLFRLLQIFPDNDFNELVKIGAELAL